MDVTPVGAVKVQQPVQLPVVASDPEHLPAARPMLDDRRRMPAPELEPVDPRTMAVRQLLVGVMLIVVGALVTAATYSTARHDGDRYLLAFGPVVIGAIAMVRGFIGLIRP
jgi:hypothetical protein